MSKEFQIKDGDLIASFDLENEGGDIDFCDLFKISNGVANKIGTFIDYDVTNKIIGEQSKQISDLQSRLAEKNKEIKQLKYFKVTIGTMENNQVDISSTTYIDQDKISFAIEQLEKVKEFCEKELKECDKLLKTEFEDDFYIQSVMARESMCFDFRRTIDNQIKQLKEKNNG